MANYLITKKREKNLALTPRGGYNNGTQPLVLLLVVGYDFLY